MTHPLTPIRRIGQVISVSGSPTPTVEVAIGGDPSVTVFAPYADSYYPIVNDYVVLLGNQGDWFVVGRPYTGTGRLGLLAQATGPSSQTDFGTTGGVAVTLTVNLIVGRWYRLNGSMIGTWITNDGIPTMKIVDGLVLGGTELVRMTGSGTTVITGKVWTSDGFCIWQAGSTASHSFAMTAQSTAGALRVSAGQCPFWIEDIGT